MCPNYSLKLGTPAAFLPLVHYFVLHYSHHVAEWVTEQGYELVGRSDARFMQGLYKLLRTEFNYHPSLTLAQFFAVGYGEHKVIMLCDLFRMCKDKDVELDRKTAKKKAVATYVTFACACAFAPSVRARLHTSVLVVCLCSYFFS